jgi:hypothetical protein
MPRRVLCIVMIRSLRSTVRPNVLSIGDRTQPGGWWRRLLGGTRGIVTNVMFTLEQVVPWGRSFEEYCHMFSLSSDDLARRILGCGDGPAGFNAQATRRGATVVSCDPIYQWDTAQIRSRITATYDTVLDQARRNADEFVWDSIASVEELGAVRMAAMAEFLEDYSRGQANGRYLAAELPSLPFADASFDLALCSHLLFLYSLQLDEAFHHQSIRELCRVAQEVRIFPLLALGGQRSPYIDAVMPSVRAAGYEVAIERVPYEFQRGGHEMMRIRAPKG